MTSVLIIDDHPIVLQGLRRVLEDAGVKPVLEARDVTSGYRLFRRNRATKGVEAEGRIVGPDIRAADRDLRNQVPVDGVAEGFIDADALHVDGEPLRRALQRRSREAAIA